MPSSGWYPESKIASWGPNWGRSLGYLDTFLSGVCNKDTTTLTLVQRLFPENNKHITFSMGV